MLLIKRLNPLLFFILGIAFSGCSGNRLQQPVTTVDVIPTQMEAVPSINASNAPTVLSTDLNTIVPTMIKPGQVSTVTPQSTTGQGKELAESICIVCHSFDRVSNSHKSQAEWEITVRRMVDHGAPLNDEQQLSIIEYLAIMYK
jgi:cytochrome c5